MNAKKSIGSALPWLARICAAVLFLIWGSFFLEHLQDWILREGEILPPTNVWVALAFHLVMMLGLLLLVFLPRLGAVITVIGTVAFFASIGYQVFPWLALLNLIPIVLLLMAWVVRRRQRP